MHKPCAENRELGNDTVCLDTFYKLKPADVRKVKFRDVCISTMDIQARFFMEDFLCRLAPAFKRHAQNSDLQCPCSNESGGCVFNFPRYCAQLARRMVCKPVDGEWPLWKCVSGECDLCGWDVKIGDECTILWSDIEDAVYRLWQKVPHPKSGIVEKYKDTTIMGDVKMEGEKFLRVCIVVNFTCVAPDWDLNHML